MKAISFCNRIIEFSFYSLFLFVPLVFSGKTSELFEFPKMWLTFAVTIVIIFAWIVKIILSKKFFVQRTILDIPIALFLLSHIISTIFSLDPHVSLWGYYSRFNGGLLSIFSYILLYYAFVSNLKSMHAIRVLYVSLISGFIVAIWGLPSHFGIDPTCYVFRGSFDTSCWTDAFKPTIRIFSTLGQPAWLAAYVSILIPIGAVYFLKNKLTQIASSTKNQKLNSDSTINAKIKRHLSKSTFFSSLFLILTSLFYACLIFTNTKGGFIGFWVANAIFWGGLSISEGVRLKTEKDRDGHPSFFAKIPKPFQKYFLIFNLTLLALNFFFGAPFSQVSKFSLPELTKQFSTQEQTRNSNPSGPVAAGAFGGTDSGKIRLIVWRGALNAWKDHPIFGTGVETFAYAYYKYKPVEHNVTSEWDYLYNKAHNEYLNYLTTTGIFGLGSYLLIIGLFIFRTGKWLMAKATFKKLKDDNANNTPYSINYLLVIALLAGYISILISNFFGFSVVIINLYLFLIPAFVFVIADFLKPKNLIIVPFMRTEKSINSKPSILQYVFISAAFLASAFLLLNLFLYWKADQAYGSGNSLDKSGSYQEAYPLLLNAVSLINNEPLYRDELSINMATLASALYLQKDIKTAKELKDNAVAVSDDLLKNHPNNVVFWKNRVRLFYTLAQGNPDNSKSYYDQALAAVNKAHELAPNDAKISYNLAVLYGQLGEPKKAVEILHNTTRLKPNYRDAYYALGLFYNQLASDENGAIIDPSMQQKAIEAYDYILKNIDPNDTQVKESLQSWKE